jgi:hypothetical protein
MRVVILYRQQSEYSRQVETFIRDFRVQHDSERLEVVDYDSRDGIALASLYDVLQQPAILAIGNDGGLLKSWVGPELPLMDELAYYSYAATN